ncbi:IS3 family transposase [Streptomyces sp. NPDC046984]|uniref:IS3 family transposase n=1 Tax=Streptomyces sp. NPDC046984 TaxID=3155138 RepID=UPI0033FB8C44
MQAIRGLVGEVAEADPVVAVRVISGCKAEQKIPHRIACRALGVSESWYYKWCDREPTAREVRRQHLAEESEEIFHWSGGTYGSPKVFIELVRRGWRVSVNTVAKVMAELGLAGRRIRRRRSLTKPGKRPAAPDFVRRDFNAEEPDLVWVGDMTEIETGEGKLYLATVIDLFSRRLLGYAMGERHDTELVVASLNMAAATRGGDVRGVIMHTDRGSEGGFNRSSQHLVISEVWDGSSSAGGRSGGAPEVEVTGASEISASYRGGVLGRNCQGASRGGSGWGYRRGAGGGHALVPAMWGHATVRSAAAFGQVPVVF